MEKGGQWFRNTVSRLAGKDCQLDWSHIGIICFPNIKNRDFFRTNQIESDKEMLKVCIAYFDFQYTLFYLQYVLTKEELEDGEFKWIEELALPLKKIDKLEKGEEEMEKIIYI